MQDETQDASTSRRQGKTRYLANAAIVAADVAGGDGDEFPALHHFDARGRPQQAVTQCSIFWTIPELRSQDGAEFRFLTVLRPGEGGQRHRRLEVPGVLERPQHRPHFADVLCRGHHGG